MKLTDKKVDEVIAESIGEDAVEIIRFIRGKKDVSEFKISTALKLEIQEVRNILYRIHNNNLVTYNRKKDNKKGWYVSYWTFDKTRVKELMKKIQEEKLAKFRERLHVESTNVNNFFICPKAHTRMDFHTAIGHSFRCTDCGNLMQQQDNTKTINFLKEKIKEMETVAEA